MLALIFSGKQAVSMVLNVLQVVTITNFSAYESDATLAQKGGFALLPQQVSLVSS